MTIGNWEADERPLRVDMPFDEERLAGTDRKESTAIMEEDGPVPLIEDGATSDRFPVHSAREGVKVELQAESNTFWATQTQIADAFGMTRQNASLKLQNIFKEGEPTKLVVCKESLRAGRDGKTLRAQEHLTPFAALKHTEKALPKPRRRNEREQKQ
jgi:hypothetical protein